MMNTLVKQLSIINTRNMIFTGLGDRMQASVCFHGFNGDVSLDFTCFMIGDLIFQISVGEN